MFQGEGHASAVSSPAHALGELPGLGTVENAEQNAVEKLGCRAADTRHPTAQQNNQGYRGLWSVDSGRGGWTGSVGEVGVGFSLALKSGWGTNEKYSGRGHSCAEIMEGGKYRWGLVGKLWGWSSEWEQVRLRVIWQAAFEWLRTPDPGVSHAVLQCGNESEGPRVALCSLQGPKENPGPGAGWELAGI